MVLSPLDIKNKSFSTKMRGYNQDEVEDFLDQIITDYEEAIRDKRELEKSLKHADEKLTYFNELKDALNQSIIVAQDTADKLKNSASRESEVMLSTATADAKAIVTKAQNQADATITEANTRSAEIMQDATQRATQLARETDDLKKKIREFHRNLALNLESQLEIVRSKDWDDLLSPFSTYVDPSHTAVLEVLDREHDSRNKAIVESEGHTKAIELDEVAAAIETVDSVTQEEAKEIFFPDEKKMKRRNPLKNRPNN